MLVTEFLDLAALLVPERTAIIFEGKRYSYAQLKEMVNRLADSLNKLGLAKGERKAKEVVDAYLKVGLDRPSAFLSEITDNVNGVSNTKLNTLLVE